MWKIEITWKQLYEDIYVKFTKNESDQKTFIKEIFPDGLYQKMFVRGGKVQGKYVSLVCRATIDAKKRFLDASDYLIQLKNEAHEDYNFEENPILQEFAENWKRLVPACTETQENKVAKAVYRLIDKIEEEKDELFIKERLFQLYDKQEYAQILAVFSIIASTLCSFGMENTKFSEQDLKLHSLFLPKLVEEEEESDAIKIAQEMLHREEGSLEELKECLGIALNNPYEKGKANYLLARRAYQLKDKKAGNAFLKEAVKFSYEPAKLWKNNADAETMLEKIRIAYQNPASDGEDVMRCCKGCEKILYLTPAVEKSYRGEAAFVLYKYIRAGKYQSSTNETADYYLKISNNCGFYLAQEEWKVNNESRIIPQIMRAETATVGRCYSNTKNKYAKIFEKTIPESWERWLAEFDLTVMQMKIHEKTAKRFLFLDDDFEKNIEDLFELLQLIKDEKPETKELNIEIFIRNDSEIARALIDTALSGLPEYTIPVFIIDDDKTAAQQLLSHHPLFYPVRAVDLKESAKKLKEDRPILHFIILGTSRVAKWLVREAFWMMGFRENAILCKITVLDEKGEEFVRKIKAEYPGMVKSDFDVEEIELPEVLGENIDFHSFQLADILKNIMNETPYGYFAVATESDEENLSLATRIREILVRNNIEQRNETALENPNPIAILCRKDQIAWTAKRLVIEKEIYGDRWFNTWSFIPFGNLSAYYSWDLMAGGTFEKLSKCIHYQFAGLSPEETKVGSEKAEQQDKVYYGRQYNHDSSYSLALSMQYRIFQFRDINGNQIMPIAWEIWDEKAFASVEQLNYLANRSRGVKESEYKTIAVWEHDRWVRWMLSRGWLPASADDAVFAVKCGNERQQLFVAKLHPCICAYEGQKELKLALKNECGMDKDFYSYDMANIKDTKRLLALEWLKEREKEDGKRD